jgi:hypothetical protein
MHASHRLQGAIGVSAVVQPQAPHRAARCRNRSPGHRFN